jgi:phosphopentomutase
MRRAIFMVLDGAGVGALPDASIYGDADSNTLGNLCRIVDLRLPFLRRMGLGNILPLMGVPPVPDPLCLTGRLAPHSAGKDTTVGHWEHMGLVTPRPFPTYPDGFPREITEPFEQRIGRPILGNRPASGTAIIAQLGAEHMDTGRPIVYTSADSVFQIAAHIDVVPLERLYKWCEIARHLLTGPHAVARVIARPFAGSPGSFYRTTDRRDFSLEPPSPTYLDALAETGIPVIGLGKIGEVFVGRGVTQTAKVTSNDDNLRLVRELVRHESKWLSFELGLLFTNLVDFDMVWGHRNDVEGFAHGLEAVDAALPGILEGMRPDDLFIMTADHGVDPTTESTDHSREYVPLLVYPPPPGTPHAVYEGSFADTGATVYEHLTEELRNSESGPRSFPDSALSGTPLQKLQPGRGWRHFTPAQPSPTEGSPDLPGRAGPAEVDEAADWLARGVGPAPDLGVILGSGLLPSLSRRAVTRVPYSAVPHWRTGAVAGHKYELALCTLGACRIALLEGRVHQYEGFDLSEEQLPVRTLATWGVRRLLLTSASGAVASELKPGRLVVVTQVLDFQHARGDGRPATLLATAPSLAGRLDAALHSTSGVRAGSGAGVHASLPGPQYETPAELGLLRALGVDTVSMSPAAELRAAHDCGLEVSVVAVVTNAGDTTHEEVLTATARATSALDALVCALTATSMGSTE